MMNKIQFANSIIDKFCKDENISRKDLNKRHTYLSSGLTVAMEYLGMLTREDKIKYCDGIEFQYIELDENNQFVDVHTLSVREIIELLPN